MSSDGTDAADAAAQPLAKRAGKGTKLATGAASNEAAAPQTAIYPYDCPVLAAPAPVDIKKGDPCPGNSTPALVDPFPNITAFDKANGLSQLKPDSADCASMPQQNIFCWTKEQQGTYAYCAISKTMETFQYFLTADKHLNDAKGFHADPDAPNPQCQCKMVAGVYTCP
jgi:hypothetical protein